MCLYFQNMPVYVLCDPAPQRQVYVKSSHLQNITNIRQYFQLHNDEEEVEIYHLKVQVRFFFLLL